jgi:drug/metabolite transporter (DMT)-like permease
MRKEFHLLKMFFWPSIAIFGGLVVMNIESLQGEENNLFSWGYIQGIFYGLVALATWTWYVVYNSNFMQKHPDVNPFQWTALMGFMTLVFTVIMIAGKFLVLGGDHFYQFHWEHESGRLFIIGALILGILCSWVAFVLWNAASFRLPPALAGQISIMETIFGLVFVFLIEQSVPTALELAGIFLILAGISFALYFFMQLEQSEEASPV